MSTNFNLSSEFTLLVNQLQARPDDIALKKNLLRYLPQMKALAEVNPLALYRLAQIYPKNSAQYQQTILQSADLGCTNAMLEASQFLLKSKNPKDFPKVIEYLRKIHLSKDSFMIKNAKALLKAHPTLAKTVQDKIKMHAPQKSRQIFFKNKAKEKVQKLTEIIESGPSIKI